MWWKLAQMVDSTVDSTQRPYSYPCKGGVWLLSVWEVHLGSPDMFRAVLFTGCKQLHFLTMLSLFSLFLADVYST